MAKIALICLFAFVCVQLATATPRVARDAPAETKPDDLAQTFNNIKDSLDGLMKNIQDSDVLKDLNKKLEQFGSELSAQAKQITDKIQAAAKTE